MFEAVFGYPFPLILHSEADLLFVDYTLDHDLLIRVQVVSMICRIGNGLAYDEQERFFDRVR